MESQIPRPHVDHYHDDEHLPSAVIEGEDEHHHHEKKSVLKKVKAKAKMIKETLKKHGHGHDHDHHQRDHSDDEEEYEDEEIVEDPEVHGAPMCESSAAIRSGGVDLEKPTVVAEDRYDSKLTRRDPQTKPFAQWQDDENSFSGQPPMANVGRSGVTTVVPEVSFSSGTYGTTKGSESTGIFVDGRREENMGQSSKIKMGTAAAAAALVEDPHAPKDQPEKSNYQSKVTDPTGAGGEEAGITPILRSFKKMNVYDDETEPKPEGTANLYTGSHDQFSPEPLPPHTTTTTTNPEDPGSGLKRFDASKPQDMPHDTSTRQPLDQSSSSYTQKISSATCAIADKAVAAKNVVVSKLGYGGNEDSTSTETNTRRGGETSANSKSESASAAEYGHKIATAVTQKLAPVYEKVADVGSSVMSKVHGTGTGTGQEIGDKGQDRGVASVKEYLAEKLRPSDEDKALSEMISDALHKRKQEVVEKPVGKVTEWEEVARRLDTTSGEEDSPKREGAVTDSNSDTGVGGNVSTRASGKATQAVVDRLKGAVNTWFFSGGDQSQTSQASLGSSTAHGNERISSSTGEEVGFGHGQEDGVCVGERRLQESGD